MCNVCSAMHWNQFVAEVTTRHDLKSQQDLDQFVSDLYTETWDPNLPLWRAYVINNLDDGRQLPGRDKVQYIR